jgi:hypothetical protein
VTLTERERLKAVLYRAAHSPCLLCGGSPDSAALFIPDDPQKFGAPVGKVRFIPYSLCKHCRQDEGYADRVEKIILYQVTTNIHGAVNSGRQRAAVEVL